MNVVGLDNVSVSYGAGAVLTGTSIGVARGERVGVVGRNGAGKSTLIKIVAGAREPDDGRVSRTRNLSIGYVGQVDALDPDATVRESVWAGRPEHSVVGDPAIRAVLDALLGGSSDLWGRPVRSLSGGERRRVALAATLSERHDLLVLDEPTNHMDLAGVSALAGLLRSRASALVLVTHDRWLLDEVCVTTWEVAGGTVRSYDGGYAAYVLARAERERQAATAEEKRRNRMRKELAWLRRGPPARTSKPKFRIEAANALIVDEPPPRDRTELARIAGKRLGKVVIELHDVTVAVPTAPAHGERTLLDHVTWQLAPGDRVAVLGSNGTGKSTLLNVLAGLGAPDGGSMSGEVVRGQTVQVGRLSQTGEPLAGTRLRDAVEEVALSISLADGSDVTAVQLLERLGFSPDRHRALIGDLSGGERRRVQILRTLLAGPNVLLLDEPTNDLDTETLAALEDVLDGWPGTLVVVSHDRYFLERTTDRQVALLGDGRIRDLPRGVAGYLELLSSPAPSSAERAPGTPRGAPAAARMRQARKDAARLERALARLTEREAQVHREMADQATDHEALGRLTAVLSDLQAERAAAEEEWLAAAEIAYPD